MKTYVKAPIDIDLDFSYLTNYFRKYKNIVGKNKLAVFSANICLNLMENDKLQKEASNCINLVKKWLNNNSSVGTEELHLHGSKIYKNYNTIIQPPYICKDFAAVRSAACAALDVCVDKSLYSVMAAAYACRCGVYENCGDYIFDLIDLYANIFNAEQYLVKTKILEDFAAQDIDSLTDVDINMILDYIKEEFELDLGRLAVNHRIISEFIRKQIKYETSI